MRRIKSRLIGVLIGGSGCVLFWLLFPNEVLPWISHDVLGLPGPGSAICVIFGPFVIGVCLLASIVSGERWTAFMAGATFALLHALLTPLLYPGAPIVGTVGPAALRVSAVLTAVLCLELLLRWLGNVSMNLRHILAAAGANLVLILFYWTMVYPAVGKKPLKPLNAAILLGATVITAVLVAAILSFLHSGHFHKKDS